MITTRYPEIMTAQKCRLEVASILASGLLRRVRQAKMANPRAHQTSLQASLIGLDLPSETRLSVANGTHGLGPLGDGDET